MLNIDKPYILTMINEMLLIFRAIRQEECSYI